MSLLNNQKYIYRHSQPHVLSIGNLLRLYSEASDRPEGQELGGGAVGGQEVLQEVKF